MENSNSPLALIVEIDFNTFELLRSEFIQQGTRFAVFTDISKAWEVALNKSVDIVVVGVNAHQTNLFQFLSHLRTIHSEAVFIIVCTELERDIAHDAVGKGIAHYHLQIPCLADEVKSLIGHVVKTQIDVRYQKIRKTLATFTSLPMPEKFQSRLKQVLSQPDISLHHIVAEMEKNPSLVVKVLRIANSAFYSTRSPIVSLKDAVLFIGTNYLETLVMAANVFENIHKVASTDVRIQYETLWKSACRRASIAKRIAEISDMNVDPSVAQVTALLQDIGLLARLCLEPDAYTRMTTIVRKDRISQYGGELRVFSTPHDELGAALLKRWNFSQEIVFAVANHHGETFDDPVTKIVQIADALDSGGCTEPHDEGLFPEIVEWGERLKEMLRTIQAQTN